MITWLLQVGIVVLVRVRSLHYIKKDWNPGQKILLSPLHIMLGLMKNFVKILNNDKPAFKYFRNRFLRISEDKIEEGIIISSEIRYFLKVF